MHGEVALRQPYRLLALDVNIMSDLRHSNAASACEYKTCVGSLVQEGA